VKAIKRANLIVMSIVLVLLSAVSMTAVPGCAPPAEVGKATIAARVDAKVTKVELEAMYPQATTRPAAVSKAITHFQTISDLLKPGEAWFRHVAPEEVDKK
jgi:hypothetical protein